MDIALLIIGIILLLVGFIGCVAPIIPGPPIAYVGVLLLQFTGKHPFSTIFLVIMGIVVLGVTVLDYIIPMIGTKKFGGTKYGAWGCIIGTVVGMFVFPPLGIIIMPFIGAFIGEMISDNSINKALKAAFGSFLGFLSGALIKMAVCVVMIAAFIWGVF